MKTKLLLAALAAFTGCSLLIPGIGPETCDDGTPNRCLNGVLTACQDGVEVRVGCGSFVDESGIEIAIECNEAADACGACGDERVDIGEFCDVGLDPANCRADCFGPVACGNGFEEPGEECDDSNIQALDGCNEACQREDCGDGVVQAGLGEVCDDGGTEGGDGCRADCKGLEVCGDGFVDADTGETCDNGNLIDGDGCAANCLIEDCGDGITAGIELCDDGGTEGGDGCRADCRGLEECGDGLLDTEAGETCDDGNTNDNDNCSAQCRLETCGNGDLDPGEGCDDNNTVGGDGCDADCLGIEVCGDGIQDSAIGETCDDNNLTNGDGCSAACRDEECGDGVVNNVDEVCDPPLQGGCAANCLSLCGDGIVQAPEECDDANANNADVCRNDCTFSCGSGIAADNRAFDPSTQHCYLLFNSTRDWLSAQNDCVNKSGHLATISNATENVLVRSLSTNELWIGLNDIAAEGRFVTPTAERTTFLNFAGTEPNNINDEDCVAMRAGAGVLNWNDSRCETNLRYVCEIETPVCGNGVSEAGEECDDGNTNNADNCSTSCQFTCGQGSGGNASAFDAATGLCFVFFNNSRSWTSARTDCVARGGKLATIHSNFENELLGGLSNEDLWIGFNDQQNEAGFTDGNFVWDAGVPNSIATGESTGLTFFAGGQPNQQSGSGDCVHMFENSFEWNDADCNDSNRYVCEF